MTDAEREALRFELRDSYWRQPMKWLAWCGLCQDWFPSPSGYEEFSSHRVMHAGTDT